MLIAATSDTLPLTVVSDYADTVLAQQISQIRGVGQVDINGQQKPAVRIQVDPGKISALGLGLEDIRPQVAAATANAPKGTFDGSKQSVTVYDNDQILSAKPGTTSSSRTQRRAGPGARYRAGGRRSGEHQTRRLGVRGRRRARPTSTSAIRRAIILVIRKLPGANVIGTVDRIKEALPKLQLSIPPAIQVKHHVRSHADHTCLGERRGVHADPDWRCS